MRLSRASSLLLCLLIVPGPLSCQWANAPMRPEPAPQAVTHVVVCWLKDPGDATARQKVIDASKGLRMIPGVVDVRVGTMLLDPPP